MRRTLIRLVAALEILGAVLLVVFDLLADPGYGRNRANLRWYRNGRAGRRASRSQAWPGRFVVVRQRQPDLAKLARRLETAK